MNSYAYYNGHFGKREDIRIPLSDRSIFFGDAIYDAAIGSYDRILWEDEHIDRFLLNAKRMGFQHSLTKKGLSELLREVAVKSMMRSYFLYFQLSRDSKNRIHSAKNTDVNLLITIDEMEISKNHLPLKLLTVKDDRYNLCDIKTTNLIPAVLASTRAENEGYDEAVFVRGNIVTECAKSNIAIIKQGRVITHPKTSRILPGITREHLKHVCEKNNIPFYEKKFTVSDMMSADEILVTSTSKLCKTVSVINNRHVGAKASDLAEQICDKLYTEYSTFCQL